MKLTNELCPRSKALSLIDEGIITAEQLAEMCVGYMSHDDVEDMLDANELSERFLED
tara:strand:+ start:304 stop:474 length:171 start_codon:yes stop_codon:yes gene_type:complete